MDGTGGESRLLLVFSKQLECWHGGNDQSIVRAVGWWTGPDRTLFAGEMYRTRGFGAGEGWVWHLLQMIGHIDEMCRHCQLLT